MPGFNFDNTYFHALDGMYVPARPHNFVEPELVLLNETLAIALGLDVEELNEKGADWFGGRVAVPGADPLSQAYAGHQFGGFSPQLGDGRAVLLGEIVSPKGNRTDLQLKGSGRTPFSRGGDGRATLGPILREYLMSEAMFALGVPTTRGLAVVTTGEQVRRSALLPGALLARVASSHLRVGSFQFFAARGEVDRVQRLTEYALARHFPEHAHAENPALALLQQVIVAQAKLISSWMLVGFVHGVMNTDNCTLSGETIDYGPCAFLDVYDPDTVFSSIDYHHRYAYGKQPGIGGWNLTRFAETLVPLLDENQDRAIAIAEEALLTYNETYLQHWQDGLSKKLGLVEVHDSDRALTTDLLALLQDQNVDFTRFFRGLSDLLRGAGLGCLGLFSKPEAFTAWTERWKSRLASEGRPFIRVAAEMDLVNPL
ncbi:MAG: YdiU family protein, partial [Rhodobacterales bacterium]|nr:YdiU family protein [Rhodobacterales bacterium]